MRNTRKNTRKVLTGTLLVIVLVGAAAVVAAPGPHRGGPWAGAHGGAFAGAFHRHLARLEFIAGELELTEDQRQAARALVDTAIDDSRPVLRALLDGRRELRAAARPDAYDAAAVASLAQRQGALIADLIVMRTELRAGLAGVLTPEQLEQLESRRRARFGG